MQAGDGLLQVLGAERVVAELVAGADQVVQGGLPVGGDGVQLAAEDDVAGVAGPVEEGDPPDIRLGSAANMARIGVMPTPPAMNSTRRPVSAGVNAP